jgi:hypothetical protein
MRRLKLHTLHQWGCAHKWKTTHSLSQADGPDGVRYHKCLRCRLQVKTGEVPEVSWNERDLVTLLQTLLPEGTPVYLRDHGITKLPLHGLNATLERHG